MKLRRVRIENVRSFLEPAELVIDGDISIVIGPNGGGKTNLLDTTTTIIRRNLLTSWVSRRTPTAEEPDRYTFSVNDVLDSVQLERHSLGKSRQQRVEIEVEVTQRDVTNILSIKNEATKLAEYSERKYIGAPIREASGWDPSLIAVGQRHSYRILDNALQAPETKEAAQFGRYLALFEADSRLRDELGMAQLSTPMVSLPVNRSAAAFQASLSLANYNEYDYKRQVDAATSRSGGDIVTMAIGRIARKYRMLLEKDSGQARKEFYDDPNIRSLTSILKDLGYGWNLESINPLANQYDVRLTKQGFSFLVNAASSGERELLTYLFTIYALNVRDALIVVDEPELHLHPKWQSMLLGLFERLAAETGNQFLLATHSPVFVSPASIQYVSRVFSNNQQSEVVRLKNDALPEARHLFSIVNSQNNERMFFADKVVLVEGISDRLFFDAVLKRLGIGTGTTKTYEVISVGGKGFFGPYRALLDACKVPHAMIADLDHVCELGTDVVKKMFAVNSSNIKADVAENPKSIDGEALVARLEEAILSNNLEDLKDLWEYIKARRLKLRSDLSAEERQVLDTFVESLRAKSIFVLSKGDLESYLPQGHRSKDLDKLIRFVNSPDFWEALPDWSREEIHLIASEAVKL